MQFPIAYPVRSDLRAALSFAITRSINRGQYEKLSREWRARTDTKRECSQSNEDRREASELVAFPLTVCAIGSLFALLLYVVYDWRTHRIANASLEPGSLVRACDPLGETTKPVFLCYHCTTWGQATLRLQSRQTPPNPAKSNRTTNNHALFSFFCPFFAAKPRRTTTNHNEPHHNQHVPFSPQTEVKITGAGYFPGAAPRQNQKAIGV